jgi:hypothetical protein
MWFEYGVDRYKVEDGLGSVSTVWGTFGDNHNEGKTIYGLTKGTVYYYRVCAQNLNDGALHCGMVRQLQTRGGVNNLPPAVQPPVGVPTIPVVQKPSAVTIAATGVNSSAATLSGGFASNSCAVDAVYFEYGTNPGDLSKDTNHFTVDQASGLMRAVAGNLRSSTKYYYRAIAENCGGTGYGDVKSFTTAKRAVTTNTTVIKKPVVVVEQVKETEPINIIFGASNGSSFLQLEIDDNQEYMVTGELVEYTVSWKNLSDKVELTDIELNIELPNETTFVDTTKGRYNPDAHSVFVRLPDLETLESGSMQVLVQAKAKADRGDVIVASVTGAFDNPLTGAQENAIDFDSDEYDMNQYQRSGVGASAFGAGILPRTLLGWLLLLLGVGFLILLARWIIARLPTPAGRRVVYQTPMQDPEYVAYRPVNS